MIIDFPPGAFPLLSQVRSRMLVGGCGCRRVHVMLAVQRRSNLDPFLDTLQAMV
jgi:hypothetical protein